MSFVLNESTVFLGAASPPMEFKFSRPTEDTTTVYTDAVLKVYFFRQSAKGVPSAPATPTLTLTEGNGITRRTNTASLASFTVQLSASHLSTLFGTDDIAARRIGYIATLTPVGYAEYQGLLQDDYDGWFIVARQGYVGNDVVKAV